MRSVMTVIYFADGTRVGPADHAYRALRPEGVARPHPRRASSPPARSTPCSGRAPRPGSQGAAGVFRSRKSTSGRDHRVVRRCPRPPARRRARSPRDATSKPPATPPKVGKAGFGSSAFDDARRAVAARRRARRRCCCRTATKLPGTGARPLVPPKRDHRDVDVRRLRQVLDVAPAAADRERGRVEVDACEHCALVCSRADVADGAVPACRRRTEVTLRPELG